MKYFSVAIKAVLLFAFVFAFSAIADSVTDPISESAFFAKLLELLGQVKGASLMAVAMIVAQAVMYFFRTSLADFAGKYKLAVVAVINLVVVILGGLVAGLPLLGAVFNQAVFVAVQIAVNELLKHINEA